MIANLQDYFGPETIYMWLNFGVLPLWIILIFFRNSKINLIVISSIFMPIFFSCLYIYIVYILVSNAESIADYLNLYLGIENLLVLFSNDNFLLIFWIHFIGINLFLGSWVSRDSLRYNIPLLPSGIALILIYFTGPLGLVLYWFIRIFYSKKISFHD